MDFLSLLVGLGVDGVSIALLGYAIYYRRHRVPELPVAFVALNLGVFAAVTLLAGQRGGLGLGFGLFAILSIVRLRSGALNQIEVGYYFLALTLGLVNGLGVAAGGPRQLPIAVALDVVLLAAIAVLDRRYGTPLVRCTVLLDVVHRDERSLRADLAARLDAEIVGCEILAVDYVQDTVECAVSCRPRDRDLVGSPR